MPCTVIMFYNIKHLKQVYCYDLRAIFFLFFLIKKRKSGWGNTTHLLKKHQYYVLCNIMRKNT